MSTWLPVDTNHLPPFGGKSALEPGTVKQFQTSLVTVAERYQASTTTPGGAKPKSPSPALTEAHQLSDSRARRTCNFLHSCYLGSTTALLFTSSLGAFRHALSVRRNIRTNSRDQIAFFPNIATPKQKRYTRTSRRR